MNYYLVLYIIIGAICQYDYHRSLSFWDKVSLKNGLSDTQFNVMMVTISFVIVIGWPIFLVKNLINK